MKRKIKLMMIAASAAVMMFTAAYQAKAQNRFIPVADTGLITLEPNQILKVFVAVGDVTGDGVQVRFRQMKYGPCLTSLKLCASSSTLTSPVALAPTEATSATSVVDAADYVLWRTIVMGNRRDVKVTAIVFDTSTQRVVTQIIMANTEGDFH